MAGIQQNAQQLWQAIEPLQQAGTKVHIVAGNWDDVENTRRNMAGADIEVFDTIPFFRSKGVVFHERIGLLQTKRATLVFVPYWELARDLDASAKRFYEAADVAKRSSILAHPSLPKSLIMVAHGQPNWAIHHLTSQNPWAGADPDRQRVIDQLDKYLAYLTPEEIIYPHEHNPLQQMNGKNLESNTKYVLEVKGDKVSLVMDKERFGESLLQVVASYIPLQRLGTLNIPLQGNPRLTFFGGDRNPVFVS